MHSFGNVAIKWFSRVPTGGLLRYHPSNFHPQARIASRFAPWKGQQIVIEAIKRQPGVQLVLAGEALFGETDYRRELFLPTGDPAVVGRVHFLGFRNNVAALKIGIDIVVHCSTAPEPLDA